MAEDQQVGPGLFVKFGIDFSQMVGAGGAAAIVLNQTLQLFQQFENYGKQAYDATIQKAIDYQNVIEDLHNTLGITNADAQKWKSTLVSFDTDIGSFSASLRYLTMRVSDNTDAGDSLRATLKGIGVDAKDASGQYKNASDLIQDILLGLEKVPAGTERASVAAEIFGRNWYNMSELIDNGTAAVQKFKKEQPLFSEDELDRIDKAKTKMAEFNEKVNAFGALTGAGILDFGEKYLAGEQKKAERIEYAVGNLRSYLLNPNGGWGQYSNVREAMARNAANPITGGTGETPAALTIPALLTGPQTLQQKLDEISDVLLKANQRYNDAINAPAPNLETINAAKKAYNDQLMQQLDITKQIRDQKIQYQQQIDVTLPHLKEALDKAKATGLKSEIEAAQIALDQGVNSANDWAVALGKAKVSVADIKSSVTIGAGWSASTVVGAVGSDRASFMIDEMQHGVPPDVAAQAYANGVHSYIKLGGTENTLGEAINNGSAIPVINLGKNAREKAAAAKKASESTTVPDIGSTEQKTPAQTEYDTQGKALETLTTKVQKEYSKQGDAFTDYLNRIAVERATQYPVLEKLDLIHWATSEEIAKIALQKVIDFMAEAVNFGGLHPIIQNLVVMSKSGPDWTPPAFQPVSATTLTSADFTQVGQNVQNIVNAGLGQGTSADVKVVQNITNNIAADVDQASADKVNNTQVAATNRALAGVSYLGGSMI